jgi:hypothetical protein
VPRLCTFSRFGMADPAGEAPVAAVGGDAPAEAPGGAPLGEDVELSECPICFDMKPNVKMLVSALCERQLHCSSSVATRAAQVYDHFVNASCSTASLSRHSRGAGV